MKGSVRGEFKAIDMFSDATYGNKREMMYMIVPDSEGVYGGKYDLEYTFKEVLPSTFAHEMQHLMNFYHHAMTPTGEESVDDKQIAGIPNMDIKEEVWLNEGLSHLVEDLTGYGQSKNINMYLNALVTPLSPIAGGSFPCCGSEQRGGIYLFLRYLYEQHPEPMEFLRRLVISKLHGIENLEKAFNGLNPDFNEFKEFFLHTGVALALTDTNATLDSHFIYQPRKFNEGTQQWQGVCLACPEGSYYLGRYNYQPMRKRVEGTCQLFIDFRNDGYIKSIPTTLSLSVSPDSKPQGALVRIK